jgi:PAS domain S-box-containing protein
MRLMSLGVFGAKWHRQVVNSSSRRARRFAGRWALVYAAAASLWILLSDGVLQFVVSDPDLTGRIQQLKGLFFVASTGVLLYVAVFRTARRMQAQQKLLQRRSEEIALADSRWQHLMTELDEVAWFATPDLQRVIYVSDAVRRIYGRSPQEFIGKPGLWRSVVHPQDLPDLLNSIRAMKVSGFKHNEYRVLHTNGRWRWVSDRSSLLRDAQGRVLGIGGIIEDITERRHEQTALRQRELQLADIVDTATDAIITIDAKRRIVLFNRAAEHAFRIAASSAIGRPIDQFIPHALSSAPPPGRSPSNEMARAGGLQVLRACRADGEEFPCEASISRLDTDQGPVMTVVLRDATEVRAAEAARDAQATAEAASRAKTEFLSRMSHELRTPLNAVLGFSQLLQTATNEPLSSTQRAQVHYIHQAGWHLLALINDVLDVSRIEAGQMQVQTEGVPLKPLIAEVLRMCERLAEQHKVVLVAPLQNTRELQARGDRTRLRQVLLNLLSNGIKYNRPGGRVEVRLFQENGQTCVDIDDNGIGMTPEQLAHVFEPFNRLGRERTAIEGTGIGLTLTRELVLLMDGRITLNSEPGRGTCVRVHLPDTGAVAAELASGPSMPTDEPRHGKSDGVVLYIEDNPVNVLVVRELLAPWGGVRLFSADDGASGIEMARELQPDLILLDMRLPDMDGGQVMKALQSDPRTRELVVVALSASAMPEDVAAAKSAGALDYWTKPLDFKHFVGDVRRVLDRGRVRARTP